MRDFVRAGRIDGRFRVMYMNRDYTNSHIQESLAGGGWVNYQTPAWQGLSSGLSGFLSQRLGLDPGDRDGAGLLGPGQTSIAVLGQAYFQAERGPARLRLYRQLLETPFLNKRDTKMIPYAFEAYTLESGITSQVRVMASHVTRVKTWTDSHFVPMSVAAGFPGTDYPVSFAGAVYKPTADISLQVWDYYCYEFMNVAYFQADAAWKMGQETRLGLSAQSFLQREVGKAIDGQIRTGMVGINTEVAWRAAKLGVAGTLTDKSHDIVNPWSAYVGYTSIMEEDCDLAGQKAWLLSFAYDFKDTKLDGLSLLAMYTNAHSVSLERPNQRESNINLDYRFKGWAKGLWTRLRFARVRNSATANSNKYDDVRAILNFDF